MTKKLIAMLLCVCMMFSLVPTTVFAEGENKEVAAAAETVVQEQQQTDEQKTDEQQSDVQKTDDQQSDVQKTDEQQSDVQKTDDQQSDVQKTDEQRSDEEESDKQIDDQSDDEESEEKKSEEKNSEETEVVCVCEAHCTEDAVNTECPVCAADITGCVIAAEEEVPECTCTADACDIDNCPACSEGFVGACPYIQSLECTCPEDDCLEDCPACSFGKIDGCAFALALAGMMGDLTLKEPEATDLYDTYYFLDADGKTIEAWTQIVKNGDTLLIPPAQEKKNARFTGWAVGDTTLAANATVEINNVTGTEFTGSPVFEDVSYVYFLDKNGLVCHTAEGKPGETVDAGEFTMAVEAAKGIVVNSVLF